MTIRNGNQHRLYRCKPDGKRAGVVFNQERYKPFKATHNRAMDDYRAMLDVISSDVFQIEVFRLRVIQLDRRALPVSSDGIRDVEINFRSVESAVLLIDGVLHLRAFEPFFQ